MIEPSPLPGMQKTVIFSYARVTNIEMLTVNDGIYCVSILHWNQLSHDNMERQLSCICDTHDHVCADQDIDALCRSADYGPDNTNDRSSNEAARCQLPPARLFCNTTYKYRRPKMSLSLPTMGRKTDKQTL